MAPPDSTDRLLEMLRDPNVESRDVAQAAGVSREDAARAARAVAAIAKVSTADAVARRRSGRPCRSGRWRLREARP